MGGSISDTIANARASLKNPSRPFTPADPQRRLHAHGQLPGKDSHGRLIPPPTPLFHENVFEAERPFTSMLKTPLPAQGSFKSGRASSQTSLPKSARGERDRGESAFPEDAPNLDILTLDDDDAPPAGAPPPLAQRVFAVAAPGF